MSNTELGRHGEDLAAVFLESKGYTVLDRRYRFERAEVDLVCFQPRRDGRPGGELVFVEVKTRRGSRFGAPEDGLLPQQRRRIAKAAQAYMYERKLEGALARFDLVAIRLGRDGDEPRIDHYENAFTT